jgi:hypothetical protein
MHYEGLLAAFSHTFWQDATLLSGEGYKIDRAGADGPEATHSETHLARYQRWGRVGPGLRLYVAVFLL